jgi:hypothetical protein
LDYIYIYYIIVSRQNLELVITDLPSLTNLKRLKERKNDKTCFKKTSSEIAKLYINRTGSWSLRHL